MTYMYRYRERSMAPSVHGDGIIGRGKKGLIATTTTTALPLLLCEAHGYTRIYTIPVLVIHALLAVAATGGSSRSSH